MAFKSSAPTCTWVSVILGFLAWIVAAASLAAVQNNCEINPVGSIKNADRTAGLEAFSSMLGCNRVYRYWWYVLAYQIIVQLLAVTLILTGRLRATSTSLVGLYAIGMLLCIQFTDAFLSASDVSVSLGLSPLATRQRGTTAGALMSALFNALVILCLGTVCTETAEIGDKAEVRAELI